MAAEGTSQIDGVAGPCGADARPWAACSASDFWPCSGFPPFSLFASELAMSPSRVRGRAWAGRPPLAVVAMVVIFIAMAGHARHMLLGRERRYRDGRAPPRLSRCARSSAAWRVRLIGVFAWPLSGLLAGGGPFGGPVSRPGQSRRLWWPWRPGTALSPHCGSRPNWSTSPAPFRGRHAPRPGLGSRRRRPRCVSLPLHRRTARPPGRAPRPAGSGPAPACRRWPACRSRPAASSASCADLFGVVPVGHPQPRRLVLHQHWPEHWHPDAP